MKKIKITITTGSRSEYGILRPLIEKISKNKRFNLFLIVTGMHMSKKHGFTINDIKKDGFKIYKSFLMSSKNDTPYEISKSLGIGIMEFSKIFKNLKPDINLILGDRDEVLASALAAYHMNIPNAHIHGGDKTKAGIDEYNRHAITKISNIHFAATKLSKNRITKMGENPKHIFLTGSPSIDEIKTKIILTKNQLEKKYNLLFSGEEILLLYHPVTTDIENSVIEIKNILKAIVKTKKPIIAIAPNSDAGHNKIFKHLELAKKNNHIKLYANIPREDYLSMLKFCGMLIGNSSSGIIEAGYFDIPVVNVGIRQQNRERGGNVIDVSGSSNLILLSIKKSLKLKKMGKIKTSHVYGYGNSTKKIIEILEKISLDKKLIQKQIHY
jgi:GDP/UDP-N,N'-diacetylbacillosamine 2-epimerase (hydrolysing)